MNLARVVVFLSFIALLFSCKKKDTQSTLGLDVQPENDLLGITITDTASVFAHTQRVDSVRTYNDQYKYLGSVQDPVFGQTHVGIYSNFSIINNLTNVSYGSNPVLDSSEIVLRYDNQYTGDYNPELTYDIYLLNEVITPAVSYYTNKNFAKTKVATAKAKLTFRNSVQCLVLPFDNNLAQYILQTPSNLTTNTNFINAYKGIYISSSNTPLSPLNQGAINRYNMEDDLSGINLYYHDGNSVSAKIKTAQFTFKGTDAQRVNHIDHNYYASASPNLFDQVINNDTTKGKGSIYLNSFGGTRVKVYLPFMKAFSDSVNVSISRAELTVRVNKSTLSTAFSMPDQLALVACDPKGVEELVYDQIQDQDYIKYVGDYTNNAKYYYYKFNIARQMQKIITGKLYNYGFYLVNALPSKSLAGKRDNRIQRIVMGGKEDIMYKPVFTVTYIKYPYDK
jgi:hypothetical protein